MSDKLPFIDQVDLRVALQRLVNALTSDVELSELGEALAVAKRSLAASSADFDGTTG